jgi:hypothetical protein
VSLLPYTNLVAYPYLTYVPLVYALPAAPKEEIPAAEVYKASICFKQYCGQDLVISGQIRTFLVGSGRLRPDPDPDPGINK